MTNALVVSQQAMLAQAPAKVDDGLNFDATMQAAMDDVGGGFNQITFANNSFSVVKGGAKQTLVNPTTGMPQQELALVILNIAPKNFCSWWSQGWAPGTNAPPDAVWYQGDMPPAHVPDWVINTKKQEKGKEFKHYQVKRRTVVAMLESGPGGQGISIQTDTPFVADLGESSLYMPSAPPLLSFVDLLKVCKTYNCMPNNFIIKLVFDFSGKGAPNTLRFIPMADDTGRPFFLDANTVAHLRQVGASQAVLDMLKVKIPVAPQQLPAPDAPVVAPIQAPPAAMVPPQYTPAPVPQPAPAPQPAAPVAAPQPAANEPAMSELLARADALLANTPRGASPLAQPAPQPAPQPAAPVPQSASAPQGVDPFANLQSATPAPQPAQSQVPAGLQGLLNGLV